MLTLGSLFTGIGGMDLGLERAGFDLRWQCEIDPFCREVLNRHWPDVDRFLDAREFPPPGCMFCGFDYETRTTDRYGCPNCCADETVDHIYTVDLIAGGDPCQENSNARQTSALTQKSLGAEFIRIIAALRPWLVLRENPSRTRPDAPWPWWRFRSALEDLGYVVLPFRLRACCLGAQHRRERLFLLGERADTVRPGSQGTILRQLARKGRENKQFRDLAGCDWRDAPPRISRAVDGIPDRLHRIKALGNAVAPPVAEWIGREILAAIGEPPPLSPSPPPNN